MSLLSLLSIFLIIFSIFKFSYSSLNKNDFQINQDWSNLNLNQDWINSNKNDDFDVHQQQQHQGIVIGSRRPFITGDPELIRIPRTREIARRFFVENNNNNFEIQHGKTKRKRQPWTSRINNNNNDFDIQQDSFTDALKKDITEIARRRLIENFGRRMIGESGLESVRRFGRALLINNDEDNDNHNINNNNNHNINNNNNHNNNEFEIQHGQTKLKPFRSGFINSNVNNFEINDVNISENSYLDQESIEDFDTQGWFSYWKCYHRCRLWNPFWVCRRRCRNE